VKAYFALSFAILVFGACNTQSPIFTPAPNDPAYHCHAADGSARVDAVWCFPVDGTRTCCPANNACVPDGCEFMGDPEATTGAAYEAKRATARMAERP
jgi:hypothetical protein